MKTSNKSKTKRKRMVEKGTCITETKGKIFKQDSKIHLTFSTKKD